MDMNRLSIDDGTPGGPVTANRLPLPNDRNRSGLRLENEVLAVLQHDQRVVGRAKLAGAFDDGFEDRPDISGRRSNHAEDVATSCLVRQCLREVAGLGLNFVEQPDVLDRDHGLVGERRGQIDMPLGKRPNPLTGYQQQTDRDVLAHEGYPQHAADASPASKGVEGVFRIALGVFNKYRCLLQKDARPKRSATRFVIDFQDRAAFLFGETETRDALEIVAKTPVDDNDVGLAQTRRRVGKSVEYLLQIECRPAYDLEHVGGGRLLLQRFAQILSARLHFLEQTDIADRDHRLIGEGLQQRNLFIAERLHLWGAGGELPPYSITPPH